MKFIHLVYIACFITMALLLLMLSLGTQKLHAERLHERTACGDKGGQLVILVDGIGHGNSSVCAKVEILK